MVQISIITNISLDHTNLLGNNIEDNAREKAGIIKPFVPIIIGEHQEKTKKYFIKLQKKKTLNLFIQILRLETQNLQIINKKILIQVFAQ